MPTFGETIKKLRLKNPSLSLRKMAKEVGISATYLSRLENDREPPPSSRIISRMAKILRFDETRLFEIADRMPPDFDEAYRKNKVYKRKIPEFMRTVLDQNLSAEDWEHLIEVARFRRRG